MRAQTGQIAVDVVAVVVALGGAAGMAARASMGSEPLAGEVLAMAGAAATGEVPGEVVRTEAGDYAAAYEVGVRRSDGSVVEVQLDKDFAVISVEADDRSPRRSPRE